MERVYSVAGVEYVIRGYAPFCSYCVTIKDPLTGALRYSATDINEVFEAKNWADK